MVHLPIYTAAPRPPEAETETEAVDVELVYQPLIDAALATGAISAEEARYLNGQYRRAAVGLTVAFFKGGGHLTLGSFMEHLHRGFSMVAQHLKKHKTACSEGCSHCCSLTIVVSPVEVLWLARHLRRRGTASRVIRRATVASRHLREKGAGGRPPCPLLTLSGRCSVYDVRPIACRAWNSTDAAACARGTNIPMYHEPTWINSAMLVGITEGLTACGLDARPVELTTALEIALTQPRAEERWLDGEAVFENAVVKAIGALTDELRRGTSSDPSPVSGSVAT